MYDTNKRALTWPPKISFYYIKVSGIASGNKLIKTIRYPHSEDMISSHVKISMISMTSGLSLKLYLNSLVYHRNIFGSTSKVFGNLRTSSDIFGNFRKMFGNVRLVFVTIMGNLRKVVGNLRKIIKTPLSVLLYNKKNITR